MIPATEPVANFEGYRLERGKSYLVDQPKPDANLEIIAGMIKDFFRKSKNPIVLLDCLEYLIITNGFIPVLKFLYDIREWVILQKAIFILPFSRATIEEREFALIERIMDNYYN